MASGNDRTLASDPSGGQSQPQGKRPNTRSTSAPSGSTQQQHAQGHSRGTPIPGPNITTTHAPDGQRTEMVDIPLTIGELGPLPPPSGHRRPPIPDHPGISSQPQERSSTDRPTGLAQPLVQTPLTSVPAPAAPASGSESAPSQSARATPVTEGPRIEMVDVPLTFRGPDPNTNLASLNAGLTPEAFRDILRNEITHCIASMASAIPQHRHASQTSFPYVNDEEQPISAGNGIEVHDPHHTPRISPSPLQSEQRVQAYDYDRNVRARLTPPPSDDIAALRAELREVRSAVRQVGTCAPDIHKVLQTAQNTPFTQRISDVRISSSGKMKLPMYAGDTDPGQHLTAFSIAIGRCHFSHSEADAGKCQMFVETLEGPALTWFSRLGTHSIDSFQQLSTAFLTHYSMYIQQRASDADLWNVIQTPTEPLRAYLDRFKRVLSQIAVTETTALAALRRGLLIESRFYEDLTINHPRDLESALHRGAAFVLMEEDRKAAASRSLHTNARPPNPTPSSNPRPPQHYQHPAPAATAPRAPAPPRSAAYAIATEPKNVNTWFRPGSNYDSAPSEEAPVAQAPYCAFHKISGHRTEDCRSLQEHLFALLQNGTISMPERAARSNRQLPRRSVDGAQPRSPTPASQAIVASPDARPSAPTTSGRLPLPPPSPPRDLRINMIMGGLEGCEDSVRSIQAAERRAAPPEARSSIPEFEIFNDKISFCDADAAGLNFPHNDPLVVELSIGERYVSRVLVDTGSTVDLIYWPTLEKMGIHRSSLKPSTRPLTGFAGTIEHTIGTIKLVVMAGRIPQIVKFVVVNQEAPYNVILGTPWIHLVKAVVSTYHQCLKFPTPYGIYTLRGNQQISRSCFIAERRLRHTNVCLGVSPSADLESASREKPPAESTISICIDPDHPDRCVKIGSNLSPELQSQLTTFLIGNAETFAWTPTDMQGISADVVRHELNVDPSFKPIKQKRRKLGGERAQAVNEEVQKLLETGAIQEVKYPEWLANPVVVKKKNGKWRMCVDFTDLNKACPKDSFPLPHIDKLVESTAGNELLSFMDAFSGYNQIKMHPNDREKTAFITELGTYCYRVMPFGLKNAGATYQRLVNTMFADQLGSTMEVYIDDMLVKSIHAASHVSDLERCFSTLNAFGMKLNPAKCSFGVTSGEFLGYVVTQRGIQASLAKIDAIIDMPSPRNIREVQKLTGQVAALSRFISKSTDKCLPFYNLLRNNKKFVWNEDCEQAFATLKGYLATTPVLAKPEVGDTLYLYIAVTDYAVSGVLVKEDHGTQHPVYYISKSLDDAETRYPTLEKLALAVIVSARKLRPYFQAHSVVVLSNHPLRTILHSPTQSGRLAKWAVELSEYDIEFKPRAAAKSQVLADFLIELPAHLSTGDTDSKWTLFVDGSSSMRGSGIGIKLISPTGEIMEQSFRLGFPASNNESEYEALIAGLRLALGIGVCHIDVRCDSRLVVGQVSGDFDKRSARMLAYAELSKTLLDEFTSHSLTRIPRSENYAADALASLGSSTEPAQARTIPVECIEAPSIQAPEEPARPANPVLAITATDDEDGTSSDTDMSEPEDNSATAEWQTEIRAYIEHGTLPDDRWAARRLKTRCARYSMVDGQLFRWSASGVLLRCVTRDEARGIMLETHEGAGGNHSGGRALALKVTKQGFYWPTLLKDCLAHASKCDQCQRHASIIHTPSEALQTSALPYPFMRWAMDIIGPFPPSRQKRFVLVLTDYFTKWVEAEAFANIKDKDVQNFIWKFIICRHGLPYEIVTDNGPQFISAKIQNFCAVWGIRLSHSTPRYPQGNGQAEATNKTIVDGLRKRIHDKAGTWADELDGVLWSYRTTPRRATNATPFSLTYGVEAMSPAEVAVPGIRQAVFAANPEVNDAMMIHVSDLVEEQREQSLLRAQNYQNLAAQYYNKKTKQRVLREGDLVMRRTNPTAPGHNTGKLGANWEGPFQVSRVVKPGVYELITMAGEPVLRSWNIWNLKKYHY